MNTKFKSNAFPSLVPSRQDGFTLVELMIVLLIMGILAGIAIPQYTASIRQSNIRTLQPAMQAFAHGMERFHNENLTFVGTSAAVPGAPLPGIYPSQWPQQGTAYFNLTVQAAAGSSYTIRATPIAGTPLATVGMMELDATGARRWDKNNDGDFADVGENNWDQ